MTHDNNDARDDQVDIDARGAAEGVQALTGLVLSARWALEIIRDQGARSHSQPAVERGFLGLDQLEAAVAELRGVQGQL